jgi:hypothetical protein
MSIPILANHDQMSPPIGHMKIERGVATVEFVRPMSRKEVFSIFGNVGFIGEQQEVLNDEIVFSKLTILEWSLSPEAPT